MPFANRADAGRRLAEVLSAELTAGSDCVVLALPRGGLPVAAEIATALGAPLDLLLVRKIGVPYQPELAMGAVAEGSPLLVERDAETMRLAGVSMAEFGEILGQESREIERRRHLYLQGRSRVPLEGTTVIVVDDGLATGSTARAALRAARRQGPRRLVLAVPVAATRSLAAMRDEADAVVCLEDHEPFYAIGA
jgi:predicted phosphoribosyltransferase